MRAPRNPVLLLMRAMLEYEIGVIRSLLNTIQGSGAPPEASRENLAHAVASLMMWLYRLDPIVVSGMIAQQGWPATWDRFPKWSWDEIRERLLAIEPLWYAYLDSLTDQEFFTRQIEYEGPDGARLVRNVANVVAHVTIHNPHHWGKAIEHCRLAGWAPETPFFLGANTGIAQLYQP